MKKFYYIILILLRFSLLGGSKSNKNVLELNHHINIGLEKDNHIVKKTAYIVYETYIKFLSVMVRYHLHKKVLTHYNLSL